MRVWWWETREFDLFGAHACPRSPATRDLFRLAGPGYVVVAFVGRLPLAMSQMGTLLLVADATGSYAAGGATAGSLALANAIGAPVAGAVADRVGQRRLVLAQALAGAAGLVLIVALSRQGVPWGWQALAAGATGLAMPQIGAWPGSGGGQSRLRARIRPAITAASSTPPSRMRGLLTRRRSCSAQLSSASERHSSIRQRP